MKKRYLCPVCDQELTAKSYCPECRRLRREPIIYEGWLLPNESDHEGTFQRAAEEQKKSRSQGQTKVRTVSGKSSTSGRPVQRDGRVYDSRYLDNCKSGHAHTYGVPNEDPHKKKGGTKNWEAGKSSAGLKVVVLLMVICIGAAALWVPVKKFAEEAMTGVLELFDEKTPGEQAEEAWESVNEGEFEAEISGDGDMDGVKVLSEEEVRAAGEPCNGYYHYDVDGEEYLVRLDGYLNDLWPDVFYEMKQWESRNEVYTSESASYSYYRQEVHVALENGVSYTVTCDTATGEVIEVDVWAEEKENFGPALLLAACALEPERDRNQVWQEVQTFLSELEESEYCLTDWGISEVYLSSGTSCYGSLNCLPEYDKYQ
ncbi:MAG: hypothetical protein HFI67_02085 [Lachnospiraceae bacterium]|jgi:hypothetical protein|nr:hypothetical protein [Lachnospiraceae bacterium]